MKVCFQCHRYDIEDYINGSIVPWVDHLARQVEEVWVMTLDPPAHEPTRKNIKFHAFHRGKTRLQTALNVVRNTMTVAKKVDCFFIWQGGHYPILMWPASFLTGKKIFQWKAHPHIQWYRELYGRFCIHTTFTTSESSYPGGGRVVPVGQGVDVEHFKDQQLPRPFDFLTVSRITPSKGLHLMINSLAEIGRGHDLTVVGPTLTKEDEEYLMDLKRLARSRRIWVEWAGPRTRDQLPATYNLHKVYLNCSVTAVDRSLLEAMSCGMDLITTNQCVRESMPKEVSEWVTCKRDPTAMAEKMVDRMKGPRKNFRDLVVKEHSVQRIWELKLPVMKEVTG